MIDSLRALGSTRSCVLETETSQISLLETLLKGIHETAVNDCELSHNELWAIILMGIFIRVTVMYPDMNQDVYEVIKAPMLNHSAMVRLYSTFKACL